MKIGTVDTWQAGTRCRVRRDPVTVNGAPVTQPWREIGLCSPASLNRQLTKNEILDSASGSLQHVGTHRTRVAEVFDIVSRDLNFNNLAALYGNVIPEAFTQANTVVTDGAGHNAWPNSILPIVKVVSGVNVRQYMLSAITNVKKGATVLVKGTDYDYTAEDLDEGIIRILNGVVIAAGDAVTVTYTPKAITGDRLIVPDFSGCDTIYCDVELVWSRCDGGEKTIREFRAELDVNQTSGQMSVEKESEITVTLTKLHDPTKTFPNGRFIQVKGSMV